MIPRFDGRGLLPHDCEATLTELEASHLVTGAGIASLSWDHDRRHQLVRSLGLVASTFWSAGGIREIWINGSFVEEKGRPGDIDVYFTIDDPRDWASGAIKARLNAIEGEDIWDWSPGRRKMYPGAKIPKPPFWGKYRIECFPDYGQFSGILDQRGQMLTFPQAFRQQRDTYERKGIIELVR